MDRLDPELYCILVIFPSMRYCTGILKQRGDSSLEWVFLPENIYRNISEMIMKGKLRFHQLSEIDLVEIMVPFTNVEISSIWAEDKQW